MNKDEVKKALEYCSVVGFETACNYCAYCYRCNDLPRDALSLITEQEKEIEQLTGERNRYAETLVRYQMSSDKEIKAQIKQAKIEAVKEFVNRLEIQTIRLSAIENYHVCNLIDELLKEYEK